MVVDVVFIRSAFQDARVGRIIRSLSRKYSAVFLAWNREGIDVTLIHNMMQKSFPADSRLGFSIFNMRAPYGKYRLRSYISMILYLPLFWLWVFFKLVKYRPEVVHAFDADTVLPCFIYKKIFGKKFVFEIVDRYGITYIPKKYHRLHDAVNSFEEAFSKRSDVLITLSYDVMKSFKNKPTINSVILNCPEDFSSKRETRKDGVFILGYGGGINRGRGLEHTTSAVKTLKNVKLYMYGPIIDNTLFEDIKTVANVEYKGFLRIHDDYHMAIVNTDAIIAVYTKETPSHEITMHNKTLEAMMGGIPIITNLSPELVTEIGFGILVEYGNISQIASAITTLRDNPELRNKLGSNGRKAYLQKYNWSAMEKKLYHVYEELL
ncbi:MAG TPA: glycosyltransferase [Nitrososphaeraceae archaeon]|nr:glycosyltransferase [Nitrososphaeraceae archaeon]